MGKNIIGAAFMASLAAAVLVFLQRGKLGKTDHPIIHDRVPRLSLEDFTMYKYEQHTTVATLSGRFANFFDPDTLEMFGSIQGFNHKALKKEHFSAESAIVQFAAKGLTDLAKNSRIIKTEIEDQVKFGYGDMILFTDYMKLIHDEELLVSDLSVKVRSPQLEFLGRKGFEFNNKTGDLKVFGPLEGTLRGVEKL